MLAVTLLRFCHLDYFVIFHTVPQLLLHAWPLPP
jgi:hypothetical protein